MTGLEHPLISEIHKTMLDSVEKSEQSWNGIVFVVSNQEFFDIAGFRQDFPRLFTYEIVSFLGLTLT